MRCEWCGITVRIFLAISNKIFQCLNSFQTHSTCRSRVPEECGFGTLRDIIIPPYAISIPRIADLNKDLILGIGNNMSKPIQNTSNNNSIPQASDYVIVSSSNTNDSKNSGLISKFNENKNKKIMVFFLSLLLLFGFFFNSPLYFTIHMNIVLIQLARRTIYL